MATPEIAAADAEVTAQQAATLLNVSQSYLVGLLEAGVIEYRVIDGRYRVRASSLMDHKRESDQEQREIADELTELNRGMGLY